jgi:FkbM family methyltransferase
MSNESLLLEKRHLRVMECRHGIFAFNEGDAILGRSLDLYGEWCEAELSLLGPLIKPGGLVLDIGAYIGTHAVFFAQRVGEQGAVMAFEPQRLLSQLLATNVVLNGLTNVHVIQKALGRKPDRIRIPVVRPDVEFNFGGFSILGHDEGEMVDIVTVDALQLPRCDLIKIDVESMEADVIRGARKTLKKYRPIVFVENNIEEHSADVIRALEKCDYKCWWHIKNYYNPDNFRGNAENVFADFRPESNMVCVHRTTELHFRELEPVQGPHDTWRLASARIVAKGAQPEA